MFAAGSSVGEFGALHFQNLGRSLSVEKIGILLFGREDIKIGEF